MSSLHWSNLNPTIRHVPTTKKFYNRYTNKIAYRVLGVYIIPLAKNAEDISTYVFRRNSVNGLDIPTLIKFSESYLQRGDKFKWRCEGNSLSIFAEKEEDLYELASATLKDYATKLQSITTIASEEDRSIIESGRIIMRQPTDFRYKISIREGFKYSEDRYNLAQYLKSIRSEIKISDFLLTTMLSKYKYLHSCYFYVNDPKIVDMIALVAPKLVKQIQEVVIR